ncbi:MAG TPA: nitronate monooxygenase, partial [Lachnospiraceae bacterium]|nr:nitronate monooxygenase [Lachnospiraceae bacterium]
AAFMLGACGVQLGTRFLTAVECNVHENYKQRVLNAKDIDTIVTGKRLGHPVRTLKSPFSKSLAQREYDSTVTNEELEQMGAGTLRMAAKEGDLEKGSFMCGQIAGLIKERLTCAEIVKNITEEAENIMKGATQWVK